MNGRFLHVVFGVLAIVSGCAEEGLDLVDWSGEIPTDPDTGAIDTDGGTDTLLDTGGDVDTEPVCAGSFAGPVLFIGNSYTAFNDLPQMVASFARADGCDAQVEGIHPGGVDFSAHLQSEETLALIRSREWSAVVLQNQSQMPGFRQEDVSATTLLDAIDLAGVAREGERTPLLVYYMTWGRQDGDADNCAYYPAVCTFEGHTGALLDGYSLYEDATGDVISPVGLAWLAVYEDAGGPVAHSELYTADGSHPSLVGSYLSAAVHYYILSGQTPAGHSYTAGIDIVRAAYLQWMAELAVDSSTEEPL